MAVWGGLTNSCEKKRGEKQRRKGKIQRISRRDKKAFFSDQCKEIEENNRMGKTRDLFKKIRDTKGTFYAKMGSIKDRNGMDLTEAEDIKKKWQEFTEELYKNKYVKCNLFSLYSIVCDIVQQNPEHPQLVQSLFV